MKRFSFEKLETSTWFKVLSLVFVSVLVLCVVHRKGLTGEGLYYHDSIVVMTNMHLLFTSLLDGRLPLWSPEMNAGEPLWPLVETMPAFDPVALLAWPLSFWTGKSSLFAYQLTCILWLFTFSLGGLACSRLIIRNWWVNLSVFVVLFGGSIAWSIPAQSQGFITPYRYSTWVVYCAFLFLQRPSFRTAALFSSILAISAAGYQTNYAFYFYVCIIGCSLLFHPDFRKHLSTKLKYLPLVGTIGLVGTLPVGFAGLKLLAMYPLARATTSGGGWCYSLKSYLRGLSDHGTTSAWHGSSVLATAAVLLFILGFLYCIWLLIRRRSAPHNVSENYALSWFLCIFPLSALCFGFDLKILKPEGVFLGLRNWGFLLTPLNLSVAMMVAPGFLLISRFLSRRKSVLWGLSVLFLIAILFETLQLARRHSYFAPPLPEIAARIPKFRRPTPLKFENSRPWAFDHKSFEPFHYQGPEIQFQPAAYLEADSGVARSGAENLYRITIVTHQVRLPRYQKVLELNPDMRLAKAILGTDLPVLRVVPRCTSAADINSSESLLKKVNDPKKLSEWAVVEKLGAVRCEAAVAKPAMNIKRYDENTLEVSVKGGKGGLLVWADNYDDGWRVDVNGQTATLGIANLTNKAVFLSEDNSEVRFSYRPWGYILAFYLRALFFISCFVVVIYALLRRVTSNR